MAELKIPMIQKSFYSVADSVANKKLVQTKIRPKYAALISAASKNSGIPTVVLESFIAIESGGNPNAGSSAVGLMQIGAAGASDAIVKEKQKGRMSVGEEAIMKKHLGSTYDKTIKGLKKGQMSAGTWVGKSILYSPEFNIAVGAMYLKQLIDEFTTKDGVRMDKVVAIYNTGRYSSTAKKIIPSKKTATELIKEMPTITRSYVLKLVGENGMLDILTA